MLGSVHDADDALQDTLLRAWRALATFEGRSRRSARALPVAHGPDGDPADGLGKPLEESVWVEPYPTPDERAEQREDLELAFVAVLQDLPANERATLLMREVLGFSARETAEALGTTPTAVNSALQRARRQLGDRGGEPVARPHDDRVAALVRRYADALQRGDVDAVLGLLTEDATWSMPPMPTWYTGRPALERFLREGPATVAWRHRITSANGQPAVACYAWDQLRGAFVLFALDVLTLRGERIAAVTAFIRTVDPARFGLPEAIGA
jgi:RNA polymerase sigma-70 factor (ECF subfamily)